MTRAREASDLILPSALVHPVHEAVLARGEPSADPTDCIELSEVEKASTYRHR